MKLFARMIAIVLVLGLLAPCIGAAEETLPFTYTIENGEVTLTSYTGPDSGTVVIPDEIEGLPVTTFGANLLNRYSELKFNLPKHLKRLEKFALPLTHDIYLPATVTELAPYCLTGNGTLSCEKYSAADQYARTFGYKANYTGEVPGVREVEADGFTFWIQNGEATLVNSISEEKYTLYVPAYIGEYPVTRIASYVTPYSVEDSYTQNIYTSIVVPATVKFITGISIVRCAAYSSARVWRPSEIMPSMTRTLQSATSYTSRCRTACKSSEKTRSSSITLGGSTSMPPPAQPVRNMHSAPKRPISTITMKKARSREITPISTSRCRTARQRFLTGKTSAAQLIRSSRATLILIP